MNDLSKSGIIAKLIFALSRYNASFLYFANIEPAWLWQWLVTNLWVYFDFNIKIGINLQFNSYLLFYLSRRTMFGWLSFRNLAFWESKFAIILRFDQKGMSFLNIQYNYSIDRHCTIILLYWLSNLSSSNLRQLRAGNHS